MSNSESSSFWSKIGQQHGAHAHSPAPAPKTPAGPAAVRADATKKSGLINKHRGGTKRQSPSHATISSGSVSTISPVTPVTSTSWADSVEEDDAQARAFVANQSTLHELPQDSLMVGIVAHQTKRMEAMGITVSDQAKRIEELNATIAQQTERIVQLQEDVDNKVGYIEKLNMSLQEKEKCVIELENKVDRQEKDIVGLTNQAMEEALRVQCLNDGIQSKNARLQELEGKISTTLDMPNSDSSIKLGESLEENLHSEPTFEDLPASYTTDVAHLPEDTIAGATEFTPESVASNKREGTHHIDGEFPLLSPIEFPTLGAPTPARNLTRSVFVTAENIKKVPPPPPAKKLTLGIDPSKFQKKPLATSGQKPMHGSRRVDNGPPAIDPSKDFRRMSKAQREQFGYGPIVQIVLGSETVASLPKYAFMQVSYKAHEYWTKNPNSVGMKFQANAFTLTALGIQLEWITMHTHCNKVFSVTLKHNDSDRHNLELVRCARALGIPGMYMAHFTRKYCQAVRDGPSDVLVALIEELAWDETDPIFDCLANNWAMRCSKANAEELSSWTMKLDRLPKIAAKMQQIQARKMFAMGKTWSKDKGKVK